MHFFKILRQWKKTYKKIPYEIAYYFLSIFYLFKKNAKMSQYLAERGEATADFRPGIGGGGGRTTKSLSGSVLFGSMGTKGPSVYIYIDHILL